MFIVSIVSDQTQSRESWEIRDSTNVLKNQPES